MTRHFLVYGLVYDHVVFYVGFTSNLPSRLASHWGCDGSCSSFTAIWPRKQRGERFDHIIFGEFNNAQDARRLERMLIGHLSAWGGLANSIKPQAMMADWYPITEYDERLLQDGLTRVGLPAAGGVFVKVDASPEYVDERYDEADFVDGP